MPRAKLKSPKQAGAKTKLAASTGELHHSLATLEKDLPDKARVAPLWVDDPNPKAPPGATIIAFRSITGPLERMHERQQIDDAQYKAGRQMQTYYEQAEIGGVKAIDPSREAVDGGRMAETLTEQVQRAIQEVIRLEKALGAEGAALARHVLCLGFSIKQCAAMRGASSEREVSYMGARFREILETLAFEMKLVSADPSGGR